MNHFSSKFLRLGTFENFEHLSKLFCECSMFGMSAAGTNSRSSRIPLTFNFQILFDRVYHVTITLHFRILKNLNFRFETWKRDESLKNDITRLRSFTWRNIENSPVDNKCDSFGWILTFWPWTCIWTNHLWLRGSPYNCNFHVGIWVQGKLTKLVQWWSLIHF